MINQYIVSLISSNGAGFYLKTGTGKAWAWQGRTTVEFSSWLIPNDVATLGKAGALKPTGSVNWLLDVNLLWIVLSVNSLMLSLMQ